MFLGACTDCVPHLRPAAREYSLFELDEGHPIIYDIRVCDYDSTCIDMRARVAHNLLLSSGVDRIRAKSNPNVDIINE